MATADDVLDRCLVWVSTTAGWLMELSMLLISVNIGAGTLCVWECWSRFVPRVPCVRRHVPRDVPLNAMGMRADLA